MTFLCAQNALERKATYTHAKTAIKEKIDISEEFSSLRKRFLIISRTAHQWPVSGKELETLIHLSRTLTRACCEPVIIFPLLRGGLQRTSFVICDPPFVLLV
jgi:hypothetical protein